MKNADQTLSDRLIPALDTSNPEGHCAYVFDYSVAPPFIKTKVSRALVKILATDLKQAKLSGLCAITLSKEGRAVAKRFGMKKTGSLCFGSLVEQLRAVRY